MIDRIVTFASLYSKAARLSRKNVTDMVLVLVDKWAGEWFTDPILDKILTYIQKYEQNPSAQTLDSLADFILTKQVRIESEISSLNSRPSISYIYLTKEDIEEDVTYRRKLRAFAKDLEELHSAVFSITYGNSDWK